MRLITLVFAVVLGMPVPASAQLPLLRDNALVYAHHHLNVPNIADAKKFWVDTLAAHRSLQVHCKW